MATNPSLLPENAGRLTAPDANYPYGSAKNDSTGTTGDGTPIRAPLLNDTYGFHQALLTRAGIVPSGSAETALVSQLADAVQALGNPLGAALATIAAASTIDLTAGAPNTSQLAISGTGVTVNGFTVAANRFFVVKMTGASNTLVNSASLVTGRGANIPVVAGDSFLMRSTAADTVEIVCGDFQIDRGIGSGQSWQTFTGTRLPATTYTNTTGRTIVVKANSSLPGTGIIQILVAGVQVDYYSNPEPAVSGTFSVSAEVPNGATYRVERSGSNTVFWFELRA